VLADVIVGVDFDGALDVSATFVVDALSHGRVIDKGGAHVQGAVDVNDHDHDHATSTPLREPVISAVVSY